MGAISKPGVISFSAVLGKTKSRRLYTNHEFFYHPFKYVFKDNVLYFTHPTIDYQGKTLQACRVNDHIFETTLIGEWPIGAFYADSDSTEDQLIIDFNNSICDQ